jgi:beta-1,2-mannobiose phosphorylase / 1,2-beta-oligomannan phosphorylase
MQPKKSSQGQVRHPPILERFQGNPILRPNSHNWWETKAVFNPAAIYEGGKVHILYRAIGETENSVLGYASSSDGFNIIERLDEPVYVPREPFEGVNTFPVRENLSFSPFQSGGGGEGGCEDPRLTRIENTVYLTYVAYDGYSPPRVALSSIGIDDFMQKRWRWKKPVLISPPNVVDKNACLLPEKINGKFVIFHRIFPDILIDFVDDLDFDGKNRWLQGHFKIAVKSSSWDNLKVAAGPPPIKTKEGWLFIYHAIDEKDDLRYKIGAMLLDLKEPTRVIARTKKPILEPVAYYENYGLKYGVVYPCGAVVLNERLFVYYGGADMVTCVATANINELLARLCYEREELQISYPVHPPADIVFTAEEDVQGYCLKCRKKMKITSCRHIIMKNLRRAIQGVCSKCGTKMVKFG